MGCIAEAAPGIAGSLLLPLGTKDFYVVSSKQVCATFFFLGIRFAVFSGVHDLYPCESWHFKLFSMDKKKMWQ